MAEYQFTETPASDGEVRLEWTKDGSADPLNFWIVPADGVDAAKARVIGGELDGDYDGSIETLKTWLAAGQQ